MSVKEDLGLINKHQKEIILLNQANSLLGWDEQTYMPKKGINSKSEQSAYLSEIAHEKLIFDKLFSVLKRVKRAKLKTKDKIMIDKFFKEVLKARKLPKEFVKELSKTTTLASSAWREAREKKKFGIFRPHLEKIIKLKRKQARYIGLRGHPYNSLLDSFEEGMTAEKLKPVFEKLKRELIELLRKIESSYQYKKQKKKFTLKNFPKEIQMEFVKDVSKRIGLENERTRIDLSEHPFTTKIGVGDVRITTNFRKDPLFSFGSSIHEAGHALYELGMPEKDAYNILCDAPSYGLHESQSRFWENMIGKNKAFWKFYFPKFNKKFNLKLGKNGFDDWYKEINYVFPGKIRIESDEVHYCLHVILRFEIELGLIEGSIKVKDLPKIWNAKMKEMLGAVPKNDVEGVLQDVHWSGGAIGYFPTYALGTIYATQIFNKLKKIYLKIEKDMERGEFSKIRNWLKNNIHKHGSKYLAEDIIERACGEGLNPDVYVKYLNKKYGEIYGF